MPICLQPSCGKRFASGPTQCPYCLSTEFSTVAKYLLNSPTAEGEGKAQGMYKENESDQSIEVELTDTQIKEFWDSYEKSAAAIKSTPGRPSRKSRVIVRLQSIVRRITR